MAPSLSASAVVLPPGCCWYAGGACWSCCGGALGWALPGGALGLALWGTGCVPPLPRPSLLICPPSWLAVPACSAVAASWLARCGCCCWVGGLSVGASAWAVAWWLCGFCCRCWVLSCHLGRLLAPRVSCCPCPGVECLLPVGFVHWDGEGSPPRFKAGSQCRCSVSPRYEGIFDGELCSPPQHVDGPRLHCIDDHLLQLVLL